MSGILFTKHPFWLQSRPGAERRRDALRTAGGDVTWVDLPALGSHGNSHAPMADDNSDAVAALVLDWLKTKELS